MIYTAKVEDGGVQVTLVSLDGENFFPVPFETAAGQEEEIAGFIAPKSDQDKPYTGFSKTYLEEKGAAFGTL